MVQIVLYQGLYGKKIFILNAKKTKTLGTSLSLSQDIPCRIVSSDISPADITYSLIPYILLKSLLFVSFTCREVNEIVQFVVSDLFNVIRILHGGGRKNYLRLC